MTRFGSELGVGQRTSGGDDDSNDSDDSGSSSGGGSVTRDRGGAGAGGGGEPTVGVGDSGGGSGGGGGGGSGGGGSPGGSSPPPSDVGGPSGAAPDPEPDDPADIVSGDPGPVFGDPAGGDSSSSDSDTGPQFGPGPNTDGGLGDEDPGGDGDEIIDGTREFVDTAEANEEIIRRATTGGLLSERGESAGLLPAEVGDGRPAGIGDGRVDVSETRLRETAEDSLAFGESIDAGGAFASPADPLGAGGVAGPVASDPGPVGATDDAPPGTENPAEEFVEGAAALPFDLPGAALETETAAEAGQSLLVDDQLEDFGAGEVAETATAQGRDRAAQTGAAIRENPAGFAGSVTAGAVVGAGAFSRGSTGTLGQAVRAEVDPRIGPFGTTAETRAARGFRDFLADDRGQAQLLPESRDRDRGTDADAGTATDDDLGPDLDPFDRSDTRLRDPNREFGDVGGMADDGPTVDPSDADSRRDIGGGIGGRGEVDVRGSDADSFSDRGFGDIEGTELDPDPTDTLRDDLDVLGGGAGGLFGTPASDPATGGRAGGLLGTPGGFDATGTTADLDSGADDIPVVSPGELTRAPTDLGGDVFTDQPTDIRSDQPTDTGQDTPTDLFDNPTADTPTADTPTADTPTDPPSDTPTDPPSDVPTDPPSDPPSDPPEDVPFGLSVDPDDDERRGDDGIDDSSVVNPTRTLEEAEDFVFDAFDR